MNVLKRPHILVPFLSVVVACLLLFLGIKNLAHAEAQADTAAELDAGVAPDGGPYRALYVDAGATIAADTSTTATPSPTAAAVPDPNDDTADFLAYLMKLWRAGAFTQLIIVGLYGACIVARKRVEWLRYGYQAVFFSVVSGMLTTLAVQVAAGTTPTFPQYVSALAAAILLVINGRGEPKPTGGGAS